MCITVANNIYDKKNLEIIPSHSSDIVTGYSFTKDHHNKKNNKLGGCVSVSVIP